MVARFDCQRTTCKALAHLCRPTYDGLMRAFLIAVGSELLGIDRLDTNSLRLTECLTRHGVELLGKSVVGDALPEIARHLAGALVGADVVLMTGGLGPTSDDLTREAVATALHRPMIEEASIVDDIRRKFLGFGMTMPEVNRRQAMVIEGAEILSNRLGTAPGLRLEDAGATLFLLPGVPRELEHMIETHLEPWLQSNSIGVRLVSRSLRVSCRSESAVEESLREVYELFDPREITVLASMGDIEVRFSVVGESSAAEARLSAMAASARKALGDAVYGEHPEDTLEEVVGGLLAQTHRTVVTAESCTGGLIAQRLTGVPGSSAYFLGGFVTYSNKLKQDLLGLSPRMLRLHGAVSSEVAREMASRARKLLGADYAIAATGIAGPEGGTAERPVGTVHVAVAGPDGGADDFVDHRRLSIPGDRGRIRQLTSQWALELLRRRLIAAEPSS